MTQLADDKEIKSSLQQLDGLLEQVQHIADPVARNTTAQIIQTMMEFHGVGLGKILDRLGEAGPLGESILSDLTSDDLVSSLLLLYGLHPLDMETRVKLAIESTLPYIHSHGGNVELLRIDEEFAVHLEMQGSCHGCPSSAATLKNTIEQAIYDKAPEVTAIHVAGVEEPPKHAAHIGGLRVDGFVPIEQLSIGHHKPKINAQSLTGAAHVAT